MPVNVGVALPLLALEYVVRVKRTLDRAPGSLANGLGIIEILRCTPADACLLGGDMYDGNGAGACPGGMDNAVGRTLNLRCGNRGVNEYGGG